MADPWGNTEREPRPWPLQPLLDKTRCTLHELMERCGVAGTTVTRAAERGLTDRQADWWAVRCGYHPGEVFPGWFDSALLPGDDVFVNGGPGLEPGWRRAALYAHREYEVAA